MQHLCFYGPYANIGHEAGEISPVYLFHLLLPILPSASPTIPPNQPLRLLHTPHLCLPIQADRTRPPQASPIPPGSQIPGKTPPLPGRTVAHLPAKPEAMLAHEKIRCHSLRLFGLYLLLLLLLLLLCRLLLLLTVLWFLLLFHRSFGFALLCPDFYSALICHCFLPLLLQKSMNFGQRPPNTLGLLLGIGNEKIKFGYFKINGYYKIRMKAVALSGLNFEAPSLPFPFAARD
jgi:hypothetical protein